MIVKGIKNIYTITLPNGKKIKLWFIGKQLEVILKAYNIPFKKKVEVKNK